MINDIHMVAKEISRQLDEIDLTKESFQTPWVKATNDSAPLNAITNKHYKGGYNIMILWVIASLNQWPEGYWAGFGQWKTVGAKVNKGQKASYIIRPNMISDDEDKTFLSGFSSAKVFNSAQVEGWEAPPLPDPPNLAVRIGSIDQFIKTLGARIEENEGGRASYSPSKHRVQIPKPEYFKETDHGSATEHYYAVLFHELTHWTLHPDLCNREQDLSRKGYAFEELVAELGSAFMCFHFGIKGASRRDHAHYIKSWAQLLTDTPKAFLDASKLANKAVNFMLQHANFAPPSKLLKQAA
ncbi:MAG: ArdC family protein [Rhodospirillales bacterium]